jgi:subtilisin-like proprotein convertase family protein
MSRSSLRSAFPFSWLFPAGLKGRKRRQHRPERRRYAVEQLEERTLLSIGGMAGSGYPCNDLTPPGADRGGRDGLPSWTFMVYLDGDNNLESYAVADFLEMAVVGSNETVNIAVQFDRCSGYDASQGDWTDTRRGLVMPDSVPDTNWGSSIGEANMGDAETLVDFVNWAMTDYPAQRYALVLWDHGGGWRSPTSSGGEAAGEVVKSACWDDSNGGDYLENREVGSALASITPNIDVFGYDCCLMAMLESAHEVAGAASVFVASEKTEPGDGWPYDTILSDLNANPSWDAAQLGSDIAVRYGQSYGGGQTLSATDLAVVGAASPGGLSAAVDSLGAVIMNDCSLADYGRLQTYRNDAAYFSDTSFRDLGTFLTGAATDTQLTATIRTTAQAALTAYQATVIQNHSGSAEGATGLSIYFPAAGQQPDGDYNGTTLGFAADTQWDEFLNWWKDGPLPASIAGKAWDDFDGDGLQAAGELSLGGWTIYLDADNNGSFETGTVSAESGTVNLPIRDYTTVTSTISVSGASAPVADVNVRVNITHTYDADLDVFLIGPDGTRVELFTDVGGGGDNLANTWLDDQASVSIAAGSTPFAGRFQPEGRLATLNGQNADGDWILEVTDDAGADLGTLVDWSLEIQTGERNAQTDPITGEYLFSGLEAGTYVVREVAQSGWSQTFPDGDGTYTVTVASGENLTNANFGNQLQLPGTISGYVWDDADGDGVPHSWPGEVPLTGWTVYLDLNNDGVWQDPAEPRYVTSIPGWYSFDVMPGTYTVREITQTGWSQTAPPGGSYSVTVASGEQVTDRHFGNRFPGSISGAVWNDLDGDGLRDFGEAGLPNQTVYLDYHNIGVFDADERSTITGPDGQYAFTNVNTGVGYYIRDILATGWQHTAPSDGCRLVLLSPRITCVGQDFGIHDTRPPALVARSADLLNGGISSDPGWNWSAVAIDGSTAVVGAWCDSEFGDHAGAVYVYEDTGAGWEQVAKLHASDASIYDFFGVSVAIHDDCLVVGATGDDLATGANTAGAAYVFQNTSSGWTEMAKLVAPDGGDSAFGVSVATDGDRVLVGTLYGDGAVVDSGAAYLFQRNGTAYDFSRKLIAADGGEWDCFGYSVALAGGFLLVGAPNQRIGQAEDRGAVYSFRSDGTYQQLLAADGAAWDYFGGAIATSGSRLVVGSPLADDASSGVFDAGAAYVFDLDADVWTERTKLTAPMEQSGDQVGYRVAMSGDAILLGAPQSDAETADGGAAHLFRLEDAEWIHAGQLTAEDGVAGDQFGQSVAISGSVVLVAAPNHANGQSALPGTAYLRTAILAVDTGESCIDDATLDATPSLSFRFTEPVYGSDANVVVLDPSARPVAPDGISRYGISGWGTDTLTVTFTTPLVTSGEYTLLLSGAIRDASGNPLNGGAGATYAFTCILPALPEIATLADSPDPVVPGGTLTLAADGVVDDDGFVISVTFYRESNGVEGLQTGTDGDTPMGTDADPASGWSVDVSTGGLAAGTYTYYAQATDDDGLRSADGTAAPTTTNAVSVDLIGITVGFTDAAGTPINPGSAISVGTSFRIYVYAQDLRGLSAQGVLSAFADVAYDTLLIDVTGMVPVFDDFSTGTIDELGGRVEEAGGLENAIPDHSGTQPVLYLNAIATGEGTLTVTTEPGESVFSENQLFGMDGDLRHSTLYGSARIVIDEPDLVGTLCDAHPDHVLAGLTTLDFTVRNQGQAAAGAFDVRIVLSDDATMDSNDFTVTSVRLPSLAAGETAQWTLLDLQFPVATLYEWALRDDPPGMGIGYHSTSVEYVGLIIDPANVVTESNESNNSNQDDVTYFPWDVNADGVVTPSDAGFVVNRLGQTVPPADPRADLNGNGAVTPSDAGNVINRIGYYRADTETMVPYSRAAAMNLASSEDLLAVTVAFADSEGSPLTQVTVGQSFRIYVYAQDLRTTGTAMGVLSAFGDVVYDTSLIDVTRLVPIFNDFSTGSVDESAGRVEEGGGLENAAPGTRAPQAVFYLEATAVAFGTLAVSADVGESVFSENQLFGRDGDVRSQTSYGAGQLPIVGLMTPKIATLTDSPDPVMQGGTLTLAANGVTDADGTVVSVAFYRESNGIDGLQTGVDGDTLVGTDADPASGWSVDVSTGGLAAGTCTYYAQATDDDGLRSADGTDSVAVTNTVQAEESPRQIVCGATSTVAAAAGQGLALPIRYATSNGDDTLCGLGLRLHYNSSLLTYNGLSSVLASSLIQQQPPGSDTADWDGDPNTDKYVLVAWANLDGCWPNQALPAQLYLANFTLADGLTNGAQTVARFSASSTSVGYGFESQPITIDVNNCNLDVDGNGTADALSDGILVLRYLFDPSGQWNFADALGVGATRTTREQIRTYLDSARNTVLDVDGNGGADALSDGILALRYLFDPSGQWNFADALGTRATRTTREQIAAHLDQYNPGLASSLALEVAVLAEEPAAQLASPSTIDGNDLASVPSVTGLALNPQDCLVEVTQADAIATFVPDEDAASDANASVDDGLTARVTPAVLADRGPAADLRDGAQWSWLGDHSDTEEALGGIAVCGDEPPVVINVAAVDAILQKWSRTATDVRAAEPGLFVAPSWFREEEETVDEIWGRDSSEWRLPSLDDLASAQATA